MKKKKNSCKQPTVCKVLLPSSSCTPNLWGPSQWGIVGGPCKVVYLFRSTSRCCGNFGERKSTNGTKGRDTKQRNRKLLERRSFRSKPSSSCNIRGRRGRKSRWKIMNGTKLGVSEARVGSSWSKDQEDPCRKSASSCPLPPSIYQHRTPWEKGSDLPK